MSGFNWGNRGPVPESALWFATIGDFMFVNHKDRSYDDYKVFVRAEDVLGNCYWDEHWSTPDSDKWPFFNRDMPGVPGWVFSLLEKLDWGRDMPAAKPTRPPQVRP